jgi:hypothetical protein
VNDIEEDVCETMIDHIQNRTKLGGDLYVCFINGLDTARILKGLGEDLEQSANKKLP